MDQRLYLIMFMCQASRVFTVNLIAKDSFKDSVRVAFLFSCHFCNQAKSAALDTRKVLTAPSPHVLLFISDTKDHLPLFVVRKIVPKATFLIWMHDKASPHFINPGNKEGQTDIPRLGEGPISFYTLLRGGYRIEAARL
jgi:hypothetical protein